MPTMDRFTYLRLQGYTGTLAEMEVKLDKDSTSIYPDYWNIANSTGRLFQGSGAPSISGTAGDYYFRTDTPSTSNQRIYVCTGTTNWTALI